MNTSVFGQIEPVDEPQLQPLDDEAIELQPGTCIHGKYTVLGVLGHGGFAVVYDAQHDGLGRRVAIKVLHLRHDTPLALLERFRREARISAMVRHPNVLEVYDTGELADGSPYLVMERVNGENLAALLQRGPLPVATAVEITRQLLLGLSAIADEGIVHRDIKPDNLMLHDSGDGMPIVKLVDFGISKRVGIEPQARLTCHGALVGTPQYMSPEQIRGEEIDIRTDIYATGAVLYEALGGRAPHQSASFSELVVSVLNGQPRPLRELRPNCPVELQRIVLKALSRQRTDRYASPRELLEALEQLVEDYDLPRGAAAFRASEADEPYLLAPVRSSLISVRRMWSARLGDARRPLQLMLVALLLGTPGQVSHVHGAPALSHTTGAMDTTGGQAVDRWVEQVAHAPLAAAPIDRSPTESSDQPPGTDLEALVVRDQAEAAELKTGSDTPTALTTVAADTGVADSRAHRASVRRHSGAIAKSAAASSASSPAAARLEHAAPAPAAATQAIAPAQPAQQELDPAQQRAFDRTMQSALAALVRGRLDQAKQHYAEAARKAPHQPGAFRGLGLVAARLGKDQEARAALRRYLSLAPAAPDAATIRARIAALD
jgi:eukaryotic-like serine/threonine-protein kinase